MYLVISNIIVFPCQVRKTITPFSHRPRHIASLEIILARLVILEILIDIELPTFRFRIMIMIAYKIVYFTKRIYQLNPSLDRGSFCNIAKRCLKTLNVRSTTFLREAWRRLKSSLDSEASVQLVLAREDDIELLSKE